MGTEAKLDITKILANSTAKFFESEAGKALIQAELAKLFEDVGFEGLQYLTNEEATEKTPTESKPKAAKGLKAQQATLVPAIREHKADFDNSALRFKAEKLYKKATLRACILAFASENKFAELEAWATKKKNQELNTWWKSL